MKDTQGSNIRNITLNPEASVFQLPTKSKYAKQEDEVGPFMNGDVVKQSCGEHNPMSESSGDNEPSLNAAAVEPTMDISSELEPVMQQSVSEAASLTTVASDDETGNLMTKSQDSGNGNFVNDPKPDSEYEVETQQQQQHIGNDDTGQGGNDESLKIANSEEVDDAATGTNKTSIREETKELISHQVEYFFSRENWSSDRYLLSQMDSDQYVPVYILANCSQFKNVTKDHSIILDALKDSSFVQLDEDNNRVRPNYKRCIVILREISQATPVEEIEAIFVGEGCPKAISCEFIHNNVWYVTFESDSDAQKAYRYLRETVKTFNDKPILARIKTKPASKSNCFSVLPSYGGKPPGDQREPGPSSSITGSNPAPLGPMGPNSNMPGVPNAPPNPYSTSPRLFYPPNVINAASGFNYNNYPSPQVSTAYFYPNPNSMLNWTPPNLYDFSQFVQYNGLSPRAAFKPATNTRYNNNVGNNNNRSNGNPGASSSSETPPEEPSDGSRLIGPLANVNNVPPPPPSQPANAQSTFTHPSQGAPIHQHPTTITHRNSFTNEPHSNTAPTAREIQPQRQNMSRGGRRKMSRRDDESNGSNNSRGSSSRSSNQNQELQAKPPPEVKKPHFELQATSFPPLPNAEEVAAAAVTEEKVPEPASQSASAWSKDTHKFSDITKGTAKPKSNDGNAVEKEVQETVSAVSAPEQIISKPAPTISVTKVTMTTTVSSNIKTAPLASSGVKSAPLASSGTRATGGGGSGAVKTVSSSNGARSAPTMNITKPVASSSISNNKVTPSASGNNSVSSQSTVAKPVQTSSSSSQSVSCSNVSGSQDNNVVTVTSSSKPIPEASSSSRHDKSVVSRDVRPVREDRRPVPPRREFTGGIGRGNPRRDGNFRMSGNKENRPQQKSWREHRPDDDGWITKGGARETRNNNRDQRTSAHNFYENKNLPKTVHPMVNGDSSPPPSPKPEAENKSTSNPITVNKVATKNSKNAISNNAEKTKEETIGENDKSLNNNEGEHKPTYAKIAKASKEDMERLSANIKEKEEHDRIKKSRTGRPISKLSNERTIAGRDSKAFKPNFPVKDLPDRPPREFRGPPDNRNAAINYRQRESVRSKSPSGK